jgi:hypothetical protein
MQPYNVGKFMLQAKIVLVLVSAERFLAPEQVASLPSIRVNVGFVFTNVEKVEETVLKLPFEVTANYVPALAEIIIKGEATLSGEPKEIDEIYRNYRARKPVPPIIFETVSEYIAPNLILLGKILDVPPPLPLKQLFKSQRDQPSYCL